MQNSDQQQQVKVDEEDHHQKNAATDSCGYKYLSDGSSSQLDDFWDSWRDEIYRKKCILRLNDDCFYKIFSYLSAYDLCAVSETCRDFRRISHFYVEGHNKKLCLNWSRFYDTEEEIRLVHAKRFIRHFGQYLTQLSLKNDEFHSDDKPVRLLPLLGRYCNNLQDLTLDVTISNTMAIIQHERLINLQRLTIGVLLRRSHDHKFGPINVDELLTRFVSLKHLEVVSLRWTANEGAYVAKHYKSLESLSLRNSILPRIDMLTSFLSENHQLKRLKLSSCYVSVEKGEENFTLTLPTLNSLESLWLRSLDKYSSLSQNDLVAMKLHQLLLSDSSNDISTLKKLRINLNTFQESNPNPLLARLAINNTIEKIDISFTHQIPDELDSHLCALTALKALRFTDVNGFTNQIIKKLACELTNLTQVEFDDCDVNFTLVENFMEFSHKVNEIFLFTYVPRNRHSPLTKAMLESMIGARLRNKHNDKTLTLKVNRKYLVDGKLEDDSLMQLLRNCAPIIKVR